MAQQSSTINVPMPTITLKVSMPPLYGVRLKTAAFLIGLAGHVAGKGVDITIEAGAKPQD